MSDTSKGPSSPSDLGGVDRVWRTWPRDCVRTDRLYTSVDGKHDSNFLSDISRDNLFSDVTKNNIAVNLYTSAGWGHFSTAEDETEQGTQSLVIKSLDDLDTHLSGLSFEAPAQTISYFVEPEYSWGRLSISEEVARRLFASFSVHQQFISVLSAFGEKSNPETEQTYLTYFDRIQILNPFRTFGNPDSEVFAQTGGYDIGYLFKYVDLHGRDQKSPDDPFVIRQTGVYHKYDPHAKNAVWIFVQSSESLKERLEALFVRYKDTPIDVALQVEIHFLVLTHGARNWRPYMRHLEERFDKLNAKGSYSRTFAESEFATFKIDINDLRELYTFIDKLRILLQLVQMNYQGAKKVQQLIRRLRNRWAQESPLHELTPRLEDVCDRFDQHLYDLGGIESRLHTLTERARDVAKFVQNMIDFKAGEVNRTINAKMGDVVSTSIDEGKAMQVLAARGKANTRMMRLLMIITAVSLPGILVATIFGTNFFVFNANTRQLNVASNIWIYFVIAAGIVSCIFLLWLIWRPRRIMKTLRAITRSIFKTILLKKNDPDIEKQGSNTTGTTL
ncbi:hypothetical protein TWF696_003945 [Orbilia brochopaga]|uniref:CorA-like transporter domain-containing protein n=1 Tax=Orbilia brochopaga TaxID=3140254 RepID=A0AAV9V4Y7_9PEZI